MNTERPHPSTVPHPARRRALRAGLALGLAGLAGGAGARGGQPAPTRVEVWKSPTCGCCGDWIAHLREQGFAVSATDTAINAMRARLGMPEKFASCHTARVGGYLIEGHVPAADIRRLLAEKPAALGLAVPGMPIGSPGMDGPAYGGRRDAFDVLLVQRDGTSRVWRHVA